MTEHGGFTELRAKWDESGRAHKDEDVFPTVATWGRTGKDFAALTVAALPPTCYPSIVEFGCGPGRVTRWLAKYYQHVFAVDIAPVMADRVNALGLANVTTITDDGTGLVAGTHEVDAVYSSLVLMHNRREDVQRIFTEFRRIVRVGGRVAFQMPCYEAHYEPLSWRQVAQWTQPELIALAEATGFTPTRIWANAGRYVRQQSIGPYHFELHIFDG